MRSAYGLRSLFVAIAIVATLCAVTVPIARWYYYVRAEAYASSCDSHLGQIAHALLVYREEHGALPPAFICDSNGRRMHSWRVLILPYLGWEDLFRRYDFSQPWDSPANARLQSEMPDYYRCVSTDTQSETPF